MSELHPNHKYRSLDQSGLERLRSVLIKKVAVAQLSSDFNDPLWTARQ